MGIEETTRDVSRAREQEAMSRPIANGHERDRQRGGKSMYGGHYLPTARPSRSRRADGSS